jgi:hypothetical protein
VRNIDWRVRKPEFICKLPRETTYEILDKLGTAADRCELATWNSTNPIDVKMDKKKTVMIVMPAPGDPGNADELPWRAGAQREVAS